MIWVMVGLLAWLAIGALIAWGWARFRGDDDA